MRFYFNTNDLLKPLGSDTPEKSSGDTRDIGGIDAVATPSELYSSRDAGQVYSTREHLLRIEARSDLLTSRPFVCATIIYSRVILRVIIPRHMGTEAPPL